MTSTPPGGADIVDYAETVRAGGWSLRSGLVRFAQREPRRASMILELVRRTDAALHPSARLLADTDGRSVAVARAARDRASGADDIDAIVDAIVDGDGTAALDAAEAAVVPLLVVALELDALGDVVATWAADPVDPPPLDVIDDHAGRAFRHLAGLGVARETRPPRR